MRASNSFLEVSMERRLTGLFLVALSIGTGACLVVDTDSIGGSGFGGDSAGGNPSIGGGDEGGGGSTGNQGGFAACGNVDDCPVPEFECYDTFCDEGTCSEPFTAAGVICSAGICDGAGYCVECIDDTDCDGADTCDVAAGLCVDETATGDCAASFCIGLPSDNTCAGCVIAAGQDACSLEFSACNSDGDGNACATCLEHVQGSAQPFCAGSAVKFEAYFDCICASGVCLD